MNLNPIKQKGLTMTALEEDGHKIKTIAISDLVPGAYKDVVVRIEDGKHILTLPSSMTGDKYRTWMKTPSGVFSKDALRSTRGNNSAEYLLVEGKKQTTIVRLIDEDEMEEFEGLRNVNGKIKDKFYMHLKTVESDQNIRWNNGYINMMITENTTDFEEAENALTEEEDTKPKAGSLFK